MPSVVESREALLAAVGAAPQMVLVRPFGNFGDEMIWEGTRALLRDRIHREISVDDLSSESGELAVIAGGGAWSRNYNEYMPETLAIAELRFERVIVFPSTFDCPVERVRTALERSRATVFARELESYAQIRDLCDARLAHDCAFFCELPDMNGSGTLDAFREDLEQSGSPRPAGNNDISETAGSFNDWLHEIARHETINTDRAHVMIAGARMGRRVNYSENSYFKVGALAESCLAEYDVHRKVDDPAHPGAEVAHPMVTISKSELPAQILSRYAMRLGPGQQIDAASLDALVDALERNPDAVAAAPVVASAEAKPLHCGGWPVIGGTDMRIAFTGSGGAIEPTGWVPERGALIRVRGRDAMPSREIADSECRAADWILRLRAEDSDRFIRVPDAVVSEATSEAAFNDSLPSRAPRAAALESHALLFDHHGLLLSESLAALVPELLGPDERIDVDRAKLLLATISARGYVWTLMQWMNGGLEPLLRSGTQLTPELTERLEWLEHRNTMLEGIEAGGWWRLREQLAPLRRRRGDRAN